MHSLLKTVDYYPCSIAKEAAGIYIRLNKMDIEPNDASKIAVLQAPRRV
jgi:hypothetical protein